MNRQIATRSQRLIAALGNSVVGALPLTLPAIAFPKSTRAMADIPPSLGGIILGLCLVQLVLVHFMQGSPGAFFTGLRVENHDGSKLKFRTTLLRSAPYLVFAVCSSEVILNATGISLLMILKLGSLLAFGFLLSSGFIMMLTGRESLMDRLTKTQVVKAHSIHVI